jgi:hypothetical protein
MRNSGRARQGACSLMHTRHTTLFAGESLRKRLATHRALPMGEHSAHARRGLAQLGAAWHATPRHGARRTTHGARRTGHSAWRTGPGARRMAWRTAWRTARHGTARYGTTPTREGPRPSPRQRPGNSTARHSMREGPRPSLRQRTSRGTARLCMEWHGAALHGTALHAQDNAHATAWHDTAPLAGHGRHARHARRARHAQHAQNAPYARHARRARRTWRARHARARSARRAGRAAHRHT